uniref:Uncharacterized protein n=1 Tax=Arion vulgaris TaxID=1028688 RepID=A0A0B7B412_9EUPU
MLPKLQERRSQHLEIKYIIKVINVTKRGRIKKIQRNWTIRKVVGTTSAIQYEKGRKNKMVHPSCKNEAKSTTKTEDLV